MHTLLDELPARYAQERAYQVLQRVFKEHFVIEETGLRAKAGQELSASSLQSPDDWEATYRHKRGEDHVGYVANVTETCHPDNPFQLIVKTQTESNNTDDAAMLAQALPELAQRTDVDEMHTDGGYNSPQVDTAMRDHQIEQVQTAIRGRKPSEDKLSLDDFDWTTDDHGQPQSVTCPHGQVGPVTPGRKEQHYRIAFDTTVCDGCPFSDSCPTQARKRTSERVGHFRQQQLDLALRRQRMTKARASGQNLRSAVEATVRAVKHPFGNGKVPVRGKPRVSVLIVGSAAMNNVRRIHRYLTSQSKENQAQQTAPKGPGSSQQHLVDSFFAPLWTRLRTSLRSLGRLMPTLACQF